MRRVAVKIAYLGDEFVGSQIQPGHRTVEGDVLSDIMKISGLGADDIGLRCASRTDRGVNALGNVVVFNTTFEDNVVLLKALNAVSGGVFYRSAASVNDDLNPRHATERIYRYILPATGMDVNAAKECASLFEGEHDLIRFCRPDGKPTVINMRSVKIEKDDEFLIIEFRSEYFLWNLIRRIVSAISSVGSGNSSIDDVKRALNGEPITFGIARADALTLVDVVYDHVEFVTPPTDMFRSRTDEESLRQRIRRTLFDSL